MLCTMKIQLISSLIALQMALPAFANEGQSEWMSGDGMSSAPQGQASNFGTMSTGQSDWMSPGMDTPPQGTMGTQASVAGLTGQSGWMQPSGQSDHSFAATSA